MVLINAKNVSGRYVVDPDIVPNRVANNIEKMLKKIKNPTTGLPVKDIAGLSKLNEGIIEQSMSEFNREITSSYADIMADLQAGSKRIYGDFQKNINKAELGVAPRDIRIGQALREKARKGEIEWLVDGQKILKGNDAEFALQEFLGGINSLNKTMYEISKVKYHQDSEARQLTVRNEDALRDAFVKYRQAESNMTKTLRPSSASNLFKFTDMTNYKELMKASLMRNTINQWKDTFKPDSKGIDDIYLYAQNAGILGYDKNQAPFVVANPYKQTTIKYGQNVESTRQIADAEKLKFVVQMLQFSNGLKVDKTAKMGEKGQREVSEVDINKMFDYLANDRNLAISSESVRQYGDYIMKELVMQRAQGTSLTLDQIDFLVDVSQTPGYDLANFGGMGSPVGWYVSKLKAVGNTVDQQLIKSYNRAIDLLIEKGSPTGDKKNSIIAEQKEVTLTRPESEVRVLYDKAQMIRNKNSELAKDQLTGFINATLAPGSTEISIIEKFMNDVPGGSEHLVAWLESQRVLKTKFTSKGALEKVIDFQSSKKFTEELRKKMAEWMAGEYSFVSKDFEMYQKDLEMHSNENVLKNWSTKKNIRNKSDAQFFDAYGFAAINATKESRKNFITDYVVETINGKHVPRDPKKLIQDMTVETTLFGTKQRVTIAQLSKISNKAAEKQIDNAISDAFNFYNSKFDRVSYNELALDRNQKIVPTEKTKAKDILYNTLNKIGERAGSTGLADNTFRLSTEFEAYIAKGNKVGIDKFNILELNNLDFVPEFRLGPLQSVKKAWDMALRRWKGENAGVEPEGLAILDFGKNSTPIAIPKSKANVIADSYIKLYERYKADSNLQAKYGKENWNDAMKAMKIVADQLKSVNKWGDAHDLAMHQMLLRELTIGKGSDSFVDMLGADSQTLAKKYYKRYSMLDAPAFNPVKIDVLNKFKPYIRDNNSKKVIEYYDKKGGYEGVVWMDEASATMDQAKHIIKHFVKHNTTWADQAGDKQAASGYDSAGYIPSRLAEFLTLNGGRMRPGDRHEVFKPLVNSNGDHYLLFGKTAFFYDKKFDSFFVKNPDLDFVLTQSAAKSMGLKDVNLLKMGEGEILNTGSLASIGKESFKIPLNTFSMKELMDPRAIGANSYSWYHYANNLEATTIFNTHFKTPLSDGINKLSELRLDPTQEFVMINAIKRYSHTDQFGGVSENAGMQNINRFLYAMNEGGSGAQRILGDAVANDVLFTKMLDRVINPKGITDSGEPFIKKKVLSSIPGNNLEPTVVLKTQGSKDVDVRIIPGEVQLDLDMRSMPLKYSGLSGVEVSLMSSKKGFTPKSDDTRLKWDTKFSELFRKKFGQGTNKDGQTLDELLLSIDNLGRLHEELMALQSDVFRQKRKSYQKLRNQGKINSKDYYGFMEKALDAATIGSEYQVDMIVNRNPINKPNSSAHLRLRGFGAGKGQINVNSMDVWNLFDGDYDIDTANIMWATNKGFRNQIRRNADHWVNTKADDAWDRHMPDISFQGQTPSAIMGNIRKYTSALLSSKAAIGQSQKTIGLVNNLDRFLQSVPKGTFGKESKYDGMKEIIDGYKLGGETHRLL